MSKKVYKNGYYLIKDMDTNRYFGWQDTDICMAPMDKPAWYSDPFMEGDGDYWLEKYDNEQAAKNGLTQVKRYGCKNPKVVHITLNDVD